jgi:hypothetical protein
MRVITSAFFTATLTIVGLRSIECSAAFALVNYNFVGGSAAATIDPSVAANLTAANYAVGSGGGLGAPTISGGKISATAFDQTSEANAKSTGDYYTFTVTLKSGTLDITGFKLTENRFNPAQGAMDFEITINGISIDGSGESTNSSATTHSYAGAAFDGLKGLTGPIEIDLVAWSPSGTSNGPADHQAWDNSAVELDGTDPPGTDSPNPEASSFVIWSVFGLLIGSRAVWRRKQSALC